jgi:hypothetical protein
MRRVLFLALVAAAALLPVGHAAADPATDKAMADQIGLRLKESGRLRNYQIHVAYQDGVAWLNGRVASAAQRDIAMSLAESAPGVDHVVCQLGVQSGERGNASPIESAFETPMGATRNMRNGVMPASGRSTPRSNMPVPAGRATNAAYNAPVNADYAAPAAGVPYAAGMGAAPAPTAYVPGGSARAVSYDNAAMPGYAWPSYAAYPNYAALTYPQQYSPTAWPYIGPFYPYPQVPLAWRKVSLEWDDGWWFLDFSAHNSSH